MSIFGNLEVKEMTGSYKEAGFIWTGLIKTSVAGVYLMSKSRKKYDEAVHIGNQITENKKYEPKVKRLLKIDD